MQRKPGFPVANCNIRMPDNIPFSAEVPSTDDESEKRRLQLINFAHSQWGFNNWSWAVNKQDLDFVDFSNGKYAAGVVAFVTVTVKSFDIHRENIGYATSVAPMKGSAIYQARKGAVTNALRETLLSFGGSVATELMELLETFKSETPAPHAPLAPLPAEPQQENNQNLPNKPMNEQRNRRKDSPESMPNNIVPANAKIRSPHPMNAPVPVPPVARAAPMPAALPKPLAHPAPAPPAPAQPRPPPPYAPQRNSNDKGFEGMTEEEARAERKRRQRQAQEEFRLKQMMKKNEDVADKSDLHKSTFDQLLSDVTTPEVVIQETGDKRKSPEPGGAPKRRGSFISKLDIVQGD